MPHTSFTPTFEQEEALRLFATGRSLVIEAGAGTGKTATLIQLANSTTRRGQYIAFNKAIVTEAGEKFGPNVSCSTAHSLAYRSVIPGTRYADRLRDSRRMKSTEIAVRLRIDPIVLDVAGERKVLAKSYLAGLAMRGVTRFCQSADGQPEAKHVPYVDGIDVPPFANGRRNSANNDVVARALVQAMRRAWADLSDEQGQLPFKHDHYLKMWHLSGPRIHADFILFDEAQDANPVLVDIVRQQTHAQLVWVGDSQQSIYSFTGAVNALEQVGAQQRCFLTRSFRFGPAVAEVANRILGALGAELTLVGTPSIASTVEAEPEPDAILCRTNATAVRSFLAALEEGKRPSLVGGGREVVDFAKAALDLQTNDYTSHPELACFGSWGEVVTYVDQDEQGSDLRLLVKLIEEFTPQTIIDALEQMPKDADADVVISTAHKSKGRQWGRLQVADDFPPVPAGEELRLLYVAVTRAQYVLDVEAVGYLTPGVQGAAFLAAAKSSAEDPASAEAHDDPEHDHANCPTCIAAARDAEYAADAEGDPGTPGPLASSSFTLYRRDRRTGRSQSVPFEDGELAASTAHANYRSGVFSMVAVYDRSGELVVALEA